MADTALGVHVAVVDRCNETNFWSFKWVVPWELGIEQKQSIFVRCLLRPQKQNLPEVNVGAWEDGNEGMRVICVVLDLFRNSF